MTESPPDELDELVAGLGRLAREREAAATSARAPEWEAVARGELDVEEAVERRREAEGEQVDRAAAYFRPFDAAETAALVDHLLEGPDNVVALDQPRQTGEGEQTPDAGSSKADGARHHDPGLGRSWWIASGLLVAAAAAIVLWWVWPPSDLVHGVDDDPQLATREPLPSYVLETDGGLKQLRGDTGGAQAEEHAPGLHLYRRDSAFEWVLRPSVHVDEDIAVRGFALVDGGSAGLPVHLEPLTKISDSGAIRIAGEIARLELEPARYTIVLVVGRHDDLPTQAAQTLEPGDTWVVRRIDVIIEE